jgi:hypothetical protein
MLFFFLLQNAQLYKLPLNQHRNKLFCYGKKAKWGRKSKNYIKIGRTIKEKFKF